MNDDRRRIAFVCVVECLFGGSAIFVAAAGVSAAPPAGAVVAPQPSPRVEQLAARIDALLDRHEGDVAVAVVNVETGESLFRRADEPMPTASLIKLAVLIETYRQDDAGRISLDERVTLEEADKVPGSGILTSHFSAGAEIALRDAVRLMTAFSDNTATNLVLDRVGLEAVNETMKSLGCPDTSIHAKVFRGDTSIAPERSKRFGLGSTTARQTVSLLARLHRKELYDAAACEAMIADLEACDDKLKVRRGLPSGTKWAHKTGSVNAVRTDAGLLETPAGTVALCVLTANNKDTSWGDENAGDLLCAEIGRAVYESFSRRLDGSRLAKPGGPAGPLALGASGDLVADLQRTLDAALDPPAGLGADGDFGPVTKAAVERFQREKGLEVTGVVGPETWKALGPIVTDDRPVPDPEAIAKEAAGLTIAPADELDGPPFVTCGAWAVGDAATGEILWEFKGTEPRHMASTTKMMAALVVASLADKDPAVLDEVVTVSADADATPGSTAGVRAGERLTVRELLYGLLLPSGNDAARAFAEHFGPRLEPPETAPAGGDPSAPVERFIAEMNRTAAKLGLSGTSFRNPHGLSAEGHRASAADLVRLASAVLKHELLCGVVSTRLHGCTVTGEGGYERNVRWENTNQLLGIAGYAGVKTGTTDAAGACLVSLGRCPTDEGEEESERRLIVAVLGATSPDARYVDTRNLFRWAWGELETE